MLHRQGGCARDGCGEMPVTLLQGVVGTQAFLGRTVRAVVDAEADERWCMAWGCLFKSSSPAMSVCMRTVRDGSLQEAWPGRSQRSGTRQMVRAVGRRVSRYGICAGCFDACSVTDACCVFRRRPGWYPAARIVGCSLRRKHSGQGGGGGWGGWSNSLA